MENQDKQPNLCTNGCGFFGSPSSGGMCSKCYKRTHQQTPQVGDIVPLTSRPSRNRIGLAHPTPTSPISPPVPAETTPLTNNGTPPTPLQDSNSADLKPPLPFTVESNGEDSMEADDLLLEKKDLVVILADGENNSPRSSKARPSTSTKGVTRCKFCSKRVGLLGYTCRCGEIFCGLHRYSDVHNCPFDYRSLGTEEIRKNNPVVKSDKVRKL